MLVLNKKTNNFYILFNPIKKKNNKKIKIITHIEYWLP